jgi:GH24 family phage-related lysozyme (muramidase)
MNANNELLILEIQKELSILDSKVQVCTIKNDTNPVPTPKPTAPTPTAPKPPAPSSSSSNPSPSGTPASTGDAGVEIGMYGQIVGSSACSIYESPDSTSGTIGTLDIGQRFQINGINGDWYQIKLPIVGFIPISFTSVQVEPITSVSENLLKFTESWEGFSSTPYQDSGGHWTIGIGHCTWGTRPADETFSQAWEQMVQTFDQIIGVIQPYINLYNYTQYQVDAIADFCFNLGTGSFENSDLLIDSTNCQNNNIIVGDFTAWSYCNGQLLQGLYRRRLAESNMFLYGEYQNN